MPGFHRSILASLLIFALASPVLGQELPQNLPQLQELASRGDASAQTRLGNLYLEGLQVVQDYAEARRWFYQAATAGEVSAMKALARLYQSGQGVRVDRQQAWEWLRKAAIQGDGEALRGVAVMYGNGLGPETAWQEMLAWIRSGRYHGVSKQTQLDHLLEQSARRGSLPGAIAMQQQGARFLAAEEFRNSALQAAIESGRLEIVRYFYLHPGKWSASLYASALEAAAGGPNPGLFKFLYQQRRQNQKNQAASLNRAVNAQQPEIVSYLLKAGVAHERIFDDAGEPLLFDAASQETPAIAELLLNRGAKVNQRNQDGRTALMVAAANSNPALLECLLAHGADINARDSQGNSALALALAAEKFENFHYLIARGANAHQTNRQGETIFFNLVRNNQVELLEEIYKKDLVTPEPYFSLGFQNPAGDTLLMAAFKANALKATSALLSWEQDLLISNRAGQTFVDLMNQRLADQAPVDEFAKRWQPLLKQSNEESYYKKYLRLEDLDRQRSEIIANMHTLQTFVETYAVDWNAQFPADLQALEVEASQPGRAYWKTLTNPVTLGTSFEQVYLSHTPQPAAGDSGKLIYLPLADGQGKNLSYRIYGVDHRGRLLSKNGNILVLSNS